MGMTFQTIKEEVAREMQLKYYQCAVVGCKVGRGFYSLESVLQHCLYSHPNAKQVGKWKKCLMKAPNEYTTEKYYEEVLSFNRRVEEKLEETIRQQIRNEQSALLSSVAIQTVPAEEKQPIQTVKEVANVPKRKAVFQGNTPQQKICKIEIPDAGTQCTSALNRIKREVSEEFHPVVSVGQGDQQNTTGSGQQRETAIINADGRQIGLLSTIKQEIIEPVAGIDVKPNLNRAPHQSQS